MLPAADNKLNNTFKKRDKIKSSLEIEVLYRVNQVIMSFPMKCYYSFSEINEHPSNIRVAFAVPKRIFKHAVDRNILKRRMREAYRLNYKTIFETFVKQREQQLELFIIYIGKETLDYGCIEKSMQVLMQKIAAISL